MYTHLTGVIKIVYQSNEVFNGVVTTNLDDKGAGQYVIPHDIKRMILSIYRLTFVSTIIRHDLSQNITFYIFCFFKVNFNC